MVRPDRRKIRKGTKSCWECKRRKARCISTTETQICDGCQRRGTRCIGQEQPDPGSSSQTSDRLGRIEDLLGQLLERLSNNSGSSGVEFDTSSLSSLGIRLTPDVALPQLSRTRFLPSPSILPSTIQTAQHDRIRNWFLEKWPSPGELEILLCNSVQVEGCTHGLVSPFCALDLDRMTQKHRLSRQMLQPPPSGSHPVLYARKMMQLASCLQVTAPPEPQVQNQISGSFDNLMLRAIETARSLVNSNDEMVGSIEGIECIAMESIYHSYTGDLCRAWLTLRRAMLIAQTMGLHRGVHPPYMGMTTDSHRQPDPDQLWFTLVHLDRYFSLMNGLPQCSSESSFAAPAKLENCTPEEKLRRLDCAAAGIILKNRENPVCDYEMVLEADRLLKKAAACMPPGWRLLYSFTNTLAKNTEAEHWARLKENVRHYHLLVQLHWPSLLCNNDDWEHEYSKISAVNASREALVRCIALTDSKYVTYHSPAFNRIAFFASLALCLGYLDVSRRDYQTAYAALFSHQRQNDRDMMEQALFNMEHMKLLEYDTASAKIKTIFQQLLAIDASASNGTKYDFRVLAENNYNGEFSSEVIDGRGLRVHIPSHGTIVIESCKEAYDSRETAATTYPSEQDAQETAFFPSFSPIMTDGVHFGLDFNAHEWTL